MGVSDRNKKIKLKRRGKNKINWELLSMNVPTLLLIFIFCYLPMGGLILAFKDFRYDLGIWGSKWVGLDNFRFLFESADAWRITRNTIGMNFIFIVTGTVFAILLGIFLNEVSRRSVKVYQTVMFVPYYLSWIVVGYIFITLFDMDLGITNQIIKLFGGDPIMWYNEPSYWPFLLTIANLWKTGGYMAVIYYTSILSIDQEYYDAAKVDGASRLQQIWYITLPAIKPTIIMLTLISLGGIIRADFGMFFFLPNESGALFPTTDVIDTYVFRTLRKIGDINMSSEASFYQSIVGFVLVVVSNGVIRRIDRESAIY